MAPSLYATKIADLGKPVSENTEKKEKKPRSEKQIAAFEKAREARKKTLEAKKSFEKPVEPASPPKTVSEPETTEVLEDIKVEVQAESSSEEPSKPKKERKTKKRAASETFEVAEKAVKIETKDEATQSEEEAPSWFKSYVIGVKEEQAKAANDKRPKKQVRIEAQAVAQKQWQQPQTRERVQNTVNNHMQKMYSMVFPNRRL